MQTTASDTTAAPATAAMQADEIGFGVIGTVSFACFLNDMMQSLVLTTYPLLRGSFHLDFSQIGLIMLTYQIMTSLLQPMVGLYTDKHPEPCSLAVGMGFTLVGLVLLSVVPDFGTVLLATALVGIGPSIFHPEPSRVVRMASGSRHGLVQSLFQAGGNAGSAMDLLLVAIILIPYGQHSLVWSSIAVLVAIFVLYHVGGWHKYERAADHGSKASSRVHAAIKLSGGQVVFTMTLLVVLLLSKYFHLASLNSYYTFFLITKFRLSTQTSQPFLFLLLFSVAVGTIVGSPIGDRIDRKMVIWVSILGVVPFTLLLPHANLFRTAVLTVIIGLVLTSAFSAILVYARELVPGKVGMVLGLFFGSAFGLGGIGAAVLGKLADATDTYNIYHLYSFLSPIGLLTVFLPNAEHRRQ